MFYQRRVPTTAHLRQPAVGRHPLPIAEPATYRTAVGSQTADLPLVRMAEDVTIALLICVDHGVAFSERAGRELAELLAPASPEVVVSVATMGIPLAIEVTRALGLDDYVILHKTPKIHLGNTYRRAGAVDHDRLAADASGSTRPGSTPSAAAGWRSSTTSSRPARRWTPRCACSAGSAPTRSSSARS